MLCLIIYNLCKDRKHEYFVLMKQRIKRETLFESMAKYSTNIDDISDVHEIEDSETIQMSNLNENDIKTASF